MIKFAQVFCRVGDYNSFTSSRGLHRMPSVLVTGTVRRMSIMNGGCYICRRKYIYRNTHTGQTLLRWFVFIYSCIAIVTIQEEFLLCTRWGDKESATAYWMTVQRAKSIDEHIIINTESKEAVKIRNSRKPTTWNTNNVSLLDARCINITRVVFNRVSLSAEQNTHTHTDNNIIISRKIDADSFVYITYLKQKCDTRIYVKICIRHFAGQSIFSH